MRVATHFLTACVRRSLDTPTAPGGVPSAVRLCGRVMLTLQTLKFNQRPFVHLNGHRKFGIFSAQIPYNMCVGSFAAFFHETNHLRKQRQYFSNLVALLC